MACRSEVFGAFRYARQRIRRKGEIAVEDLLKYSLFGFFMDISRTENWGFESQALGLNGGKKSCRWVSDLVSNMARAGCFLYWPDESHFATMYIDSMEDVFSASGMVVEKELLSWVPGLETEEVAATDGSDSHSSILSSQSNNQPCDGNNAASSTRKLKGVVQQQNGHWGAQIYANHQRIWLGTFKSDEEAAMAYDSAAIKLRSRDPDRKFPLNQKSREEHQFQSRLSTEAVLSMIKDGTYRDKLSEYISTMSSDGHKNGPGYPSVILIRNPDRFSFQQLFQKELTPSDVGKLNRLVIPKKYAIKFFPGISQRVEVAGSGAEGMQLVFYDRGMKSWNFRYCYWSSSHSFVFTKGWNRFVKDKELSLGDVVGFYECLCHDQRREGKTFCMINVVKRETRNVALDGKGKVDVQMEKQQKGFKLFGVEIN